MENHWQELWNARKINFDEFQKKYDCLKATLGVGKTQWGGVYSI